MTRACSVPKFRTGYKDNPVKNITTYSFPPDIEGRRKWLRAIYREDLKPEEITVNNSVCILHFHEQHLIKVGKKKKNANGQWETPDLVRPKLTKDAIPGIFEGQPGYNTTVPPVVRKDPEERQRALNERNEAKLQEIIKNDSIEDYSDFIENFKSKSLLEFDYKFYQDFTLLFRMSAGFNKVPEIICAVKIFKNLRIQAYFGNVPVPASKFKHVLSKDWECRHWSVFESILSILNSFSPSDFHTFDDDLNTLCTNVERMLKAWTPTLDNAEDDANIKKLAKLEFVLDQLHLLKLKVPKYTKNLILWACSLFFSFPAAYALIRNAGVLTLPHPAHLKRITGKLKSEAGLTDDQVKYLKIKFDSLEPYQRIINLLLDEVYTVPNISYKGGKITGMAANDQGANKIQSFMITSLFGKYEDIAALFPVNSTCAEDLKAMTLKVLKVLTEIGFTTLSTICDNNRMNRSMYVLLGDGALKTSIPNPNKESDEIFLLFDNEHILKCVRNNWFNQKDENQTVKFPHIDNHALIMSACVKHLKHVYHYEKNKIVKLAPSLSQKVLFPSSFERQNVSIALRAFNEKNVVALQKYFKNDVDGTGEFITIIGNYWNIVNVRAPDTGKHLRDPFRDPIRGPDDKNLRYLEKFGTFLDKWRELELPIELMENPKEPNSGKLKEEQKEPNSGRSTEGQKAPNSDKSTKRPKKLNAGKLTTDTFTSIQHTNKALIELCKYVFQRFPQAKYILLGKLQTGRLERRFGCYRQLCGGNYHISPIQVFEAEKKKKTLSLLMLESGKYGVFKISQLDESDANNESESVTLELFLLCLDLSDEVFISDIEELTLYFIAGYCSHSLLKYVSNCAECQKICVGNGDIKVDMSTQMTEETRDYLLKLTRGGLKEPTPILYAAVCSIFKLFLILISKTYEHEFLTVPNQRTLLKQLSLKKLECIIDMDEACTNNKCKRTTFKILTRVAHTLSNIFMNNYCKNKNDTVRKSRKRKMGTYCKTEKRGKDNGQVEEEDQVEEEEGDEEEDQVDNDV